MKLFIQVSLLISFIVFIFRVFIVFVSQYPREIKVHLGEDISEILIAFGFSIWAFLLLCG